jgi:hypothetical protein
MAIQNYVGPRRLIASILSAFSLRALKEARHSAQKYIANRLGFNMYDFWGQVLISRFFREMTFGPNSHLAKIPFSRPYPV